jgi:quercetin dioxygenase-like cupin family protein
MKRFTKLALAGVAAPLLVAGFTAAPASAQVVKDESGFIRFFPGKEEYKNPFGIGVMVATLYGDPSKPGMYVIRIKWPKHTMSRPHTHPQDRHVVVLSGTWYTGTGETFDPEKSVGLKAGGYMMHPAGAVHWDGTRDDEAIIQITGMGPATTDLVKPAEPAFAQQ